MNTTHMSLKTRGYRRLMVVVAVLILGTAMVSVAALAGAAEGGDSERLSCREFPTISPERKACRQVEAVRALTRRVVRQFDAMDRVTEGETTIASLGGCIQFCSDFCTGLQICGDMTWDGQDGLCLVSCESVLKDK